MWVNTEIYKLLTDQSYLTHLTCALRAQSKLMKECAPRVSMQSQETFVTRNIESKRYCVEKSTKYFRKMVLKCMTPSGCAGGIVNG